jgi:hypothetical protein
MQHNRQQRRQRVYICIAAIRTTSTRRCVHACCGMLAYLQSNKQWVTRAHAAHGAIQEKMRNQRDSIVFERVKRISNHNCMAAR